jgi:proteasome-associated ATPase
MPGTISADMQAAVLDTALSSAGDAARLEENLSLLEALRAERPEAQREVDERLLGEIGRLRRGLESACSDHEELKALLDRLTRPPWHPAIYLRPVSTRHGPGAIVFQGPSRRVVAIEDESLIPKLSAGDEVLLSHQLNVLVDRATDAGRSLQCGEVAVFDRYAGNGRIVVSSHDEEFVVDVAAPLAQAALKSGDLLRWDRALWMAFEVVEHSRGTGLFLEEAPTQSFDDIGGLDSQIAEMQRAMFMRIQHGALAAKYQLRPKRSILLWGPPGTGKTMLARALAARLRELSSSGRARFMNIKPSGLHSMWYGQSERNYREIFRVAREAGEREPEIPVVLHFDEVDAIGTARGTSVGHVDDRVLTAFMAELDGLESRGNVIVVASTNRRDTLDPALLRPGRLGDLVIHVPAPDRKAARAILSKHLGPGIPYSTNGHGADQQAARQELIEAAISRIYAANADTDLAVLLFRDGKRRPVRARDITTGAVLAKIALAAVERACVREAETGRSGVDQDDLAWAMDEEFASVAKLLTPANCRSHLADLPDTDVVGVQPVERKAARRQLYLAAR